ncbi:MAG: hypothetical protein Q9219_004281 [cf. Caloplaca sp. 3 TL-2023]
MSNVETSNTPAIDAQLEIELRHTVEKVYKSDPEQLTVRRLRIKVEQDLGLADGFFKSHSTWNAKSKNIIQSEVAALEAQSQLPSSQPTAHSSPIERQTGRDATPTNNKERSSTADEGPRKRRRSQEPSKEALSAPKQSKQKSDVNKANSHRPSSSSVVSESDEKGAATSTDTGNQEDIAGSIPNPSSESELSVLLDEDPKSKKRKQKATSKDSRSKKKEAPKPAKPIQQPTDPDSEEIKRLQGWLIKCGIRKVWFKELAPYDSSKAKIRHLKSLLADAGMTGRYSQEKAAQIREERELKADLEDVQAGNKQWGKAESDNDDGGRPRRRIAKGLQELDFLRDDDGEESD